MRYFISVISFILIFSSCKDNSENNLTVYRAAEEGLQQSVKSITLSTEIMYHALHDKLEAPETAMQTTKWQPKALEVKKLSDSMVKYINSLKEELKNEAGGNDPKNKTWENSMGVSEHLFESHGKGKELLEALVKYRQALLAVDPRVKNQFEHTINVFSNEFTFAATDSVAFTKTFFSNIPVIAANVILSKFENNVKVFENELVAFCYNRTLPGCGLGLETFTVIVGQSSNIVKAGDDLEITAGVGAFSDAAKPKFIIDGKFTRSDENGILVYKFKTPSKAGKYNKAVKIEYTRPDGTRETTTKNIEYTVVEENKAP